MKKQLIWLKIQYFLQMMMGYMASPMVNKFWISAIKMSNEALVGTILYESLHNICTINGKDICEKDEHAIMNSLGEQLDN